MASSAARFNIAAAILLGLTALGVVAFARSYGAQAAATLTVTNNADSGAGSLRQAITDAAPGDTIQFDASLGSATITLAGSPLTINKNLTITGPTGGITVDANHLSKVLVVLGGTLSMSNVNVTGGLAGNYGGGIEVNGGNLSISNSSIYGNQVTAYGPALAVMSGSATLTNVTVSGNSATNGHGGGIVAFADITLANVTLSGNSATLAAGALMVNDAPSRHVTANLTNVTISANSSASVYAAFDAHACPPDICGGLSLNITNTIIASQTSGHDCSGPDPFTTLTAVNSLDSDNSCGLFLGGPGNQPGVNPLLGPLALHAPGSTMTHALGAGSPAIDTGNDGACPPADQRGMMRLGTHCDIGAYERVPDLIQGDVDCNGAVTAVDALKELRYVAGLLVAQTQPCPGIGADVVFIWGDVDCKGEPTAVDALKVLRYVAGLSLVGSQTEPCTDIGLVIPGG